MIAPTFFPGFPVLFHSRLALIRPLTCFLILAVRSEIAEARLPHAVFADLKPLFSLSVLSVFLSVCSCLLRFAELFIAHPGFLLGGDWKWHSFHPHPCFQAEIEANERYQALQEELIAVKLREAEANLALRELTNHVADLDREWQVS